MYLTRNSPGDEIANVNFLYTTSYMYIKYNRRLVYTAQQGVGLLTSTGSLA